MDNHLPLEPYLRFSKKLWLQLKLHNPDASDEGLATTAYNMWLNLSPVQQLLFIQEYLDECAAQKVVPDFSKCNTSCSDSIEFHFEGSTEPLTKPPPRGRRVIATLPRLGTNFQDPTTHPSFTPADHFGSPAYPPTSTPAQTDASSRRPSYAPSPGRPSQLSYETAQPYAASSYAGSSSSSSGHTTPMRPQQQQPHNHTQQYQHQQQQMQAQRQLQQQQQQRQQQRASSRRSAAAPQQFFYYHQQQQQGQQQQQQHQTQQQQQQKQNPLQNAKDEAKEAEKEAHRGMFVGNQRGDAAVMSGGAVAAGRSARNMWMMSLLFQPSSVPQADGADVPEPRPAREYINTIKQLTAVHKQIQADMQREEQLHNQRLQALKEEHEQMSRGIQRLRRSRTFDALRAAVKEELGSALAAGFEAGLAGPVPLPLHMPKQRLEEQEKGDVEKEQEREESGPEHCDETHIEEKEEEKGEEGEGEGEVEEPEQPAGEERQEGEQEVAEGKSKVDREATPDHPIVGVRAVRVTSASDRDGEPPLKRPLLVQL